MERQCSFTLPANGTYRWMIWLGITQRIYRVLLMMLCVQVCNWKAKLFSRRFFKKEWIPPTMYYKMVLKEPQILCDLFIKVDISAFPLILLMSDFFRLALRIGAKPCTKLVLWRLQSTYFSESFLICSFVWAEIANEHPNKFLEQICL